MNAFDVQLTNRTDEEETFTVETVADGKRVVAGSATVAGNTTSILGRVPADVREVSVDVIADTTDRSWTQTFDLTDQPNPLEALEIQLQAPGVLRVHPLYYESPY